MNRTRPLARHMFSVLNVFLGVAENFSGDDADPKYRQSVLAEATPFGPRLNKLMQK